MSEILDLVAIGDLHLTDSTGKGGLSTYIEGSDKMVADLVISQPLKYAKEKGVKDIVLLGDICENPRMSYEAQLQLFRILRQPFQFHIILGNHDKLAEESQAGHSLEILKELQLPNVRIYEEPTDVGKIRFLPWPHQQFDKTKLNIAHIDVQGSKSDSGRLNKSDKLNHSNADAIIGHIHTSQKVRNSIYPGTLYQKNFGESLPKFFAHASYDDGWEISLIKTKPKYRLHTFQVKSRKDLKDIPVSERDLVKLVLLDGAKVTAADYQHINVVKVSTQSSAEQEALDRVAELDNGSQVEISTEEFFQAWLEQQPYDQELKAKAARLRSHYLKGQAK